MSPVQSKELQADARRQLLERRPDILQAEQLLRSANAQVAESLAESFPKIGLTALLGKVSPELSGFTLGGQQTPGELPPKDLVHFTKEAAWLDNTSRAKRREMSSSSDIDRPS